MFQRKIPPHRDDLPDEFQFRLDAVRGIFRSHQEKVQALLEQGPKQHLFGLAVLGKVPFPISARSGSSIFVQEMPCLEKSASGQGLPRARFPTLYP